MTLPMLSIDETLEKLVEHWHNQREATGTTNPAEILQEAGVRMDDPGLLEYITFLQEYECAIYEQESLEEKTPVDWMRVAKHATGGLVTGGMMGGLYGALVLGGTLGSGVLAEEKLDNSKSDLRSMYIGAGLGAAFGALMGMPGIMMALCMYTGLMTSAFHQWENEDKLTERIEKYRKSKDEGFYRKVQGMKQYYKDRILSLIYNLDSL